MITCKRCVTAKPEDQMLQRRGKPSKVCLECFGKAMSKGADKADKEAKKKLVGKSKRGVKKINGASSPDKLSMTPTYGFEAHVDENDMLNIFQRNAEAEPDQVILSKAEASTLFRRFAKFAGQD